MRPLQSYVPGWFLAALLTLSWVQGCGRSDNDSHPPAASPPAEDDAPLPLTPKLRFLTTQGSYQLSDLIPTAAPEESLTWDVLSGPGRIETTSFGPILKTEGEGTLVLIGRKGDRSRMAVTFEVRSGPTLSSVKPAIQKDGRSIIPVSPGEKVTLNVAGGVPDLKICTSQWTAVDDPIPCVQKEFTFEAGDREGTVQVWIRDGAYRESSRLEFQIAKRPGGLSYRFGDQGQLSYSAPSLFTVSPDQKSLFITSTVPTPSPETSLFRVEKRDEHGALVKAYGNEGVALLEGAFRYPARSVAVDSRGRLLLVVERRNAPGTPQTFALLRLTAEGALDKTFAQEGIWDLPDAWEFTDVALRTVTGDRILLAYAITQESDLGRSEFYTNLTSLNEVGQPDALFGKNGRVVLKLNLDSQQSLVVDDERGLIHVAGFQFVPQDSPLRPRKNSVAAYARLRLDTGAPEVDFGREGLMTIDVEYQPCCGVPEFQLQTALLYTSTGKLVLSLADKIFFVDLWVASKGLEHLTLKSGTNSYFAQTYPALQIDGRKLFAQAAQGKANFFFRMPEGNRRQDFSPIEATAYANGFSPTIFKELNSKVKVKRADGEIVPWWFELREDSKLLVLGHQLLVTLPGRVLAFELEPGSLLIW